MGSLARRSAAPAEHSGTSHRTTCAGDVITGQPPTTHVAQLDGGLPLLLTPADGGHTAGIALSLGFGSRDDPAGMRGAGHLLGRLIMSVPLEGGPSLGERVEQFGGTWGAVTGPESLTVHARVPTDDAPVVAGWMLDALTRPALSDEALGRERRNVTREPAAAGADAADPLADALQAALLAALFPSHPLGAAVGGTPDGAGRIGAGPLLQLHQRALATVPLALACDGNVQEAALRSRMSPLAMARAGGGRPRRSPHVPAGRPGAPDPVWPDGPCRLLAGAPAPTATDSRRAAFVLLGHVLGAGPGSPMHRRLRAEHGHAPMFRAWARAYSDAGVWCFLAGTDGAGGPAVVQMLRAELARLAQHGPAPADLDAAVRQARTELLRTAENGYPAVVASHHCVTGAVWSPEAERARLARVTVADVADAAAAVSEGLRVVVHPDGPGPAISERDPGRGTGATLLITPDTRRHGGAGPDGGAGPAERGFLLFKPDALERRLLQDCVADIAGAGLRVLEQHTLRLTEGQIAAVWSGIDPARRPLTAGLMRRYLSAGPSRLVLVDGPDATARLLALKSAIRRRHGAVYYANLVHSPDSAEEARRELAALLDGRYDPHARFRPAFATWHGWAMETIEAALDGWWASVPEQRGRRPTRWSPPLPAAAHRVCIYAKRHWAVAFDDMACFLAEAAGVGEPEFAVRAAFAALYDGEGFVLPTASAKAAHDMCRTVRAFGLIARGPGDGGQSGEGAGTARRPDPRE